MMNRYAPAMLAAALFALPAAAPAESYTLDSSHCSVVFSIKHLSYSYTYGIFRKTTGAIVFDPASPDSASFELVIDASSLETADDKRNEHLTGPDFFNVNQFPQITFRSKSVTQTSGAEGKKIYNVVGDLTIHGVTREVTLPVEFLGAGDSPFGDYRSGYFCQTTFKRSDFGMDFMVGPIGDTVAVTVSFEGIRK